LIQRSQQNPSWWAEKVLGVNLWAYQKIILDAVRDNKRVSVRSSDGCGKSFTASTVAMWFLYNFPNATVLTTAPTFRQVESILWREIANRHTNARVALGGTLSKTNLNISDKRFAIGLSTDEPERFQGFHNDNVLVIVDEASGVPESVHQAVENPLSSGNTRLLYIGNPTQTTGAFYQSFQSPNYKTFHISAYDTPNFASFGIVEADIVSGLWKDKVKQPLPYPSLVTPAWAREQFELFGLGSYQYIVHVLGNFPEAGINSLFALSSVENARAEIKPEGEKVASVDVSRYGDDETVYLLRQGRRVLKIETWGHQDTQYTAGRVARQLRQDTPTVTRVDDIGVGGGVADALRAEGFNVIGINVGEKATDTEKFVNKRAELYWLLSRRFADGIVSIPDNRKLISQLCDVRYTYNQKGQMQIESKEDMKKRGCKSPDIADALMMSFASYNDVPSVVSNKINVWRYA